MVRIDGSQGEGGGQILRTALTLSMLTGVPFEIYNIRARRSNPGLMPQHLVSVRAAAHITSASVNGAEKGSMQLYFEPQHPKPGNYHFDIGTAGAISLVLQTIAYPLAFCRLSSQITITGGTHVPWSPSFHFLDMHWRPIMEKLGFHFSLQLKRAGFYPKGGGEVSLRVYPCSEVRSLVLRERGELLRVEGISAIANLDPEVGYRQKRRAEERLTEKALAHQIQFIKMPAVGKNTLMLLLAHFQYAQLAYESLGAIGKRAEKVADEACDALFAALKTPATLDEHLADQLLLPLSFTSQRSEFIVPKITGHIQTNAEIIQEFLPVQINIIPIADSSAIIQVQGIDFKSTKSEKINQMR
ncbi:RNA 3'-phosphate cyclase [candidate division KSB1 bacterium]|nr:MAG: RNA 3'-phosphate cyclase [candidate division KSB1 bacterium]